MTNIKEKGWGDKREKKLIINYETEDYVKFHMDQKGKRKVITQALAQTGFR
jgi:hypothetical protein